MLKPFILRLFSALFILLFSALSLNAQQFQQEIQFYLRSVQPQWRLTDQDIIDWTVTDQYTNAQTGITYTYLQQQIKGIGIFNAISTLALRQGSVVHYANRFYPNAAGRANSSTPALTPQQAIAAAAKYLGISPAQWPVLQGQDETRLRWSFDQGDLSREPVRVDLVYVPVEEGFRLAWNVNLAPPASADWWNIRIDAQTGKFIEKNNWTLHCDFSFETGSATAAPLVKPAEAGARAALPLNGAIYNVFAFPVEAPNFGPRSVLTDPALPEASPFGWHDTDGAAGPEYTITRGNNVHAYEDKTDQDQPGYSPDGGPDLNFDFPLDFNLSPQANQDAIITNLFYTNNTIHDILYQHGFDERAGNFQANNYGKGGEEDDYVLAEAQDGGGTNNANFATPDDGYNGRMQMYLWTSSSGDPNMTVNAPAALAGMYVAPEAAFGPGISTPVTGDVVLVQDGVDPVTDACDPLVNATAIAGKIALIDRGTCTFVSKVAAAEAAGAIAVIVINNQAGAPISMGGTGTGLDIPSVMISQANGNLIKGQLNAGTTVNVTLNPSAGNQIDGSLDNGIVIHEYGHGVSNRLTGGPGNSNCLFNNEQGGEGWSDWLSLILTIESGDTGPDPRGIGTYALGEATNELGIRRYPYSTDMSVNPQTYADLAISGEVHDIGEIWSQVLWDMTWKLIDAEGFDQDWPHGTGGNNIALRLVLEAMKLQPCGPGFLDGRDAILKADSLLYDHAHSCMIWEAFARRGMGVDAKQGSPNVAGDETPGFDLPNLCKTVTAPPVALGAVDVATSCFGTFRFTDQSTNVPQAWSWNFGDGTSSNSVNPVHSYTVPGTYTVILTVSNPLGMDSDTLTVTYNGPAAPQVSADTIICEGNTVMLAAEVANGFTADWSLDGVIQFTGTNFQTPVLNSNTTYLVRQLEDKPLLHAGPKDNTFGGGGNHNSGFDGRLLFEAYAPFRLNSVLMYAQGAGERTITLYDENGAVVQSVTVNLPNGASRATLNMDIPAAGLYSLGNVSQNLYRNNSGAAYPYTLANKVRIYSSNATTNPLGFYYYFYDWEIQEKPCVSQAVPVTVSVIPGPVAGFAASIDQLQGTFTDLSTGNPNAWSWNFGDGSPVATVQNPQHVFSMPGTYNVVLTVSNGGCSSSYEQLITVTDQSSAVFDPINSLGVELFPNPASDLVQLVFNRPLSSPVSVTITDSEGRIVLSKTSEQPGDRISLPTTALPAGLYKVRVANREGSVVQKLVIYR